MIYKLAENVSVLVVGDIHAHQNQFEQLITKFPPSPNCILISVGDIYDKGFGDSVSENITRQFMKWSSQGAGYVIKGNHELKRIHKAKKENSFTPELLWLNLCPLSISFQFNNQTLLTVVHGGILPKFTWNDLANNAELCYIRTVDKDGEYIPSVYTVENGIEKLIPQRDGTIWHELYDGRFGYVASGHDTQKDGKAKFYNYSCNLDSCCYNTGVLTAALFDGNKREVFEFYGPTINVSN